MSKLGCELIDLLSKRLTIFALNPKVAIVHLIPYFRDGLEFDKPASIGEWGSFGDHISTIDSYSTAARCSKKAHSELSHGLVSRIII